MHRRTAIELWGIFRRGTVREAGPYKRTLATKRFVGRGFNLTAQVPIPEL